jgi:uncharacterized pyridoxamine 5'-phosphate oxidase family protein
MLVCCKIEKGNPLVRGSMIDESLSKEDTMYFVYAQTLCWFKHAFHHHSLSLCNKSSSIECVAPSIICVYI